MSINPSFVLVPDLLLFKVILRSFGALVSKWPVTRKQVSVEKTGVKFGGGPVLIMQ